MVTRGYRGRGTNWKIGIDIHYYIYIYIKEFVKAVYCLFNLYAEYIMRNAGLEEAQTGIKIARRNINNLRYADDTTLMADESERGE